jgi:trk system potassium uptake protein TrkA
MIIGSQQIAQYLTPMLLKTGTRVKLIESNPERSTQLADLFPDATIINADGSNQAVLLAENIEQMDSVITLPNIDEENLIISVYAKHVKVPQVITKINRTEYNEIFRDMGIDCIISPKLLCAQRIVRYVRAMQNTSGSSVLSVHRLVEGKAEALEFNVRSHRASEREVRDIRLKPLYFRLHQQRGKIVYLEATILSKPRSAINSHESDV